MSLFLYPILLHEKQASKLPVCVRRFYNAVVNQYNTKIELFPGNLLAGLFHFSRKPLYEVSAPEERENVKVQF